MANALKAANADVVGMVSLEMVGFTTTGKDPFIGSLQNWLWQVGDPQSTQLAKVFGAAAYEYQPFFFAPVAVVDWSRTGCAALRPRTLLGEWLSLCRSSPISPTSATRTTTGRRTRSTR